MTDADDRDELPLVMEEIRLIMGAQAIALTQHSDETEHATVIYENRGTEGAESYIEALTNEHPGWGRSEAVGTHRWLPFDAGAGRREGMLLPVQNLPGHSRLFIHLIFHHLTDALRTKAEAIYSDRRPFAIGYFRLWQLSRIRCRETASLKAALNLTDMGIMLIDRSGRLTFANHAARDMLADGSGIGVRRNMVRASQIRDNLRLQVAVEHVIAANGSHRSPGASQFQAPLLSLERPDAAPLIVSVLPSEEPAREPNDVAAIIYALDPSRSLEGMLGSICKIFRLSPVETRLTCLLIAGSTLAEAAEKMRIKEVSARSYLKQVFLKTNTHRQAELVQLMLSSIIRTAPTIVTEPLAAL